MAGNWYYRLRGREYGPVELTQIAELVATGRFARADEVREGAAGAWMTAEAVAELFPQDKGSAAPQDAADMLSAESFSDLVIIAENPRQKSLIDDNSASVLSDEIPTMPGRASALPGTSGNSRQAPPRRPGAGDSGVLSDQLDSLASLSGIKIVSEASLPPPGRVAAGDSGVLSQEFHRMTAGLSGLKVSLGKEFDEQPAVGKPRTGTLRGDVQNQWYWQVLGHEMGPVSFKELQRMVSNDELQANDLIKRGPAGAWGPAGSNHGLFPHGTKKEASQAPASAVPAAESASALEQAAATRVVSDNPAAERWYCWIGAQEYGPIDAVTLAKWTQENRVTRNDYVKLEQTGEWYQAGTIEGLFPPVPAVEAQPVVPTPPDEPTQTSPVAKPETPQVAARAAASEIPSTTDYDSRPSTSSFGGGAAGGGWGAARGAAPAMPRKPAVPRGKSGGGGFSMPNVNLPVVAGALAVVGGLVLGWYFFPSAGFSSAKDAEAYNTLVSMLAECQKLRAKSASEAEWTAFTDRCTNQAKPIVDRLKIEANSERQGKQHLLWASRDFLPKMLADSKTGGTEAEKLFEEHLNKARTLLNLK